MVVYDQLQALIKHAYQDLGSNGGFLLVVYNAKQHYRALRKMTNEWAYYPYANIEQATLLDKKMCTLFRWVIRLLLQLNLEHSFIALTSYGFMANNGRFSLMTPPGMAAFQPCEFQSFAFKAKNRTASRGTTS